jgi:DNA-binding MarR family transcriptional regulator
VTDYLGSGGGKRCSAAVCRRCKLGKSGHIVLRRNPGTVSTTAAIHVAAFRAALRAFLRETELGARASGLTPQRYLLLLMIKGTPDASERATVTDLAERLGLAQSTVTELVSRAEEIGIVERARSREDGRVAYLCLTDEGERRLAAAFTRLDVERARLRDAFAELEQ